MLLESLEFAAPMFSIAPIAIAAIIGAAMGAQKNSADRQANRGKRERESEIARWSPWTGMQGQRIDDKAIMGDIVKGGLAGASFGQGLGKGGGGGGGGGAQPPVQAPNQSVDPYQQMYQNRMPGQKTDFDTWSRMRGY